MQARGLWRDPHTKRDLLSATHNKIASGFRLPSRPCLPSRWLRVSTAVGAAVGAVLGAEVGAGAGAGWWAGFVVWGQVAYVLSSCGWVYVGMQWSDRAIMIGSAISGTAVMMSMVTGL